MNSKNGGVVRELPVPWRGGQLPLPNFFIIGAMKGGTTSLYFYLKEHPDVYMSPLKEPKFFAYDPHNPEHREKANKTFPITSMKAYLRLFNGVSNEKAVGEASVTYLRSRIAATAIHTHVPGAKLIVSLRNPVDRALSLYTMNARSGRETRELNEALHEALRTNETWIRSGMYYEDLNHYLNVFGKSKVKILLFDDLKTNVVGVMKDVFSFIDVDDHFVPDVSIRHNPGMVTKSKAIRGLEKLYKRNPRMKLLVRSLTPYKLRRGITKFGRKDVELTTTISSDIRYRLVNFYHADILRVQDLIGRDLRSWLN
jgi:hypothetical protein